MSETATTDDLIQRQTATSVVKSCALSLWVKLGDVQRHRNKREDGIDGWMLSFKTDCNERNMSIAMRQFIKQHKVEESGELLKCYKAVSLSERVLNRFATLNNSFQSFVINGYY